MQSDHNDLSHAISVDDMITLLQSVRDQHGGDLKVGFTGYFGEFHPIDHYDVTVKYDGIYVDQRRAQWLEISVPDIGEQPD